MRTRTIFIGGTASHVGKSWLTTAICRHLANRGLRVAPFKAQNMSNNSAACPDGAEIGRAQAAQAEACRLVPHADFNPILLKPDSDSGSQVVVNGRVWGSMRGREYYEHFDWLLQQVLDAYERLASQYEVIVIEGAGSVAELNLASRDLVNFGLACRIGAPAMLVADVDRGGVFASLIGTMSLLSPAAKVLVRSFVVNRFRGDPSLFADGVGMLESRTARPCLGVMPYDRSIHLDDEDAVSLEETSNVEADIAIVRFPHISNFTDFRLLPGVRWITEPDERDYRWIVLPGTKNTTGDLAWMRERRLDDWVVRNHRMGVRILGVCGGYQMLGERVDSIDGLGLLPVTTVMRPEKTVCPVAAVTPGGVPFSAYEIHMGETERPAGYEPFAGSEGIRANGCIGTYLHGSFENPDVVREVFEVEPLARPSKDAAYDQLAAWFASNANLKLFEELYL